MGTLQLGTRWKSKQILKEVYLKSQKRKKWKILKMPNPCNFVKNNDLHTFLQGIQNSAMTWRTTILAASMEWTHCYTMAKHFLTQCSWKLKIRTIPNYFQMVNELEKKVVIVLFNGIVFNNKCVYACV